ncbi:MAG: LamG domain-containing protein, partial [Planctomycetota bacterium]
FDACGVSLTNVDSIKVGVGGTARAGQSSGHKTASYVYFDDIQLWPQRCVPAVSYPYGDFTGDCIVGGLDLERIAADWLLSDSQPAAAPPADLPQVWYRFDEGGGGTINNDGNLGSSYNGIFPGAPNNPTWNSDVAPAVDVCDPNYSMNFDGTDYVEIPVLDLNTNDATISAWVKRNGDSPEWAGIVFARGANTTSGLNLSRGGPAKSRHMLSYHWDDWWWWYESGIMIPDGQWTFTSLVVEEDKATLYMSDGATLETATNATYHGPDQWDAIANVGRDPQAPRTMVGLVDDVRIYDRSLSVGEVMGLAGISGTVYVPLDTETNLVPRVPDPAVDPNYYPSNPDIVNFKDFDFLADNWLNEYLFP